MIAWVAPHPLRAAEALGVEVFARFLSQSALHSDGWGIAGGPHSARDAGINDAATALRHAGETPRSSAIAYLRFASRGSAVAPENLQPFVVDDLAFAHNGALSPRALALDALPVRYRRTLRGTTDSEVYFAHVRRELADGGPVAPGVARAVARMRRLYPEACLNAFLIARGGLVVVHAPGTVRPPHAAFAARGWSGDDLPAGHTVGYNRLWTATTGSGARVVATNGTLGADAALLPRDAVVRWEGSGSGSVAAQRSVPII